jgi:hypothetical protein
MYTSGWDKERSCDNIADGSLATRRKADPAEIRFLSESERRQLAAWNATQQRYPLDTCVQQLVQKQAVTTVDASGAARLRTI